MSLKQCEIAHEGISSTGWATFLQAVIEAGYTVVGTWPMRTEKPGLMTEVWITLLLYGGGVIDDLPLLERRGVRRIFGWTRVPDPTTFGRWLSVIRAECPRFDRWVTRLETLSAIGVEQPTRSEEDAD